VTVERDLHSEKQSLPRLSTEEGMQIFVRIPHRPLFALSHPRSRTSTRTPSSETKFRGKKHPEDPEHPEEVQNAVLPSDLYDRFSTSIEIKSEGSDPRPGPAENASDRELLIARDQLSANPLFLFRNGCLLSGSESNFLMRRDIVFL
jgi:hypothetical protein